MGSFGIVVLGFFALSFFDCLKEAKKSHSYDASKWLLNFFVFGLAGSLLGAVISFAIGNYVVPIEPVLIETHALEPVVAEDKDVFIVKNNNQSYFYFTKAGSDDCPLRIDSVLLEEKYIKFGEINRAVNKYKIKPKGNLKWFFFSSKSKNELVLLSKEDIL